MQRIRDALARRPELILWLIAAYYVVAVAFRVLRSQALETDEAEQLFQSQFLLMGYGRQPPFYNWLQYGVIHLIGPSVFAISLVKNLLLFLCCLFYGLAARTLLKDPRLVAIAMLGVIAMPTVSVLAQRDLTHAIATLFAVALFVYAFVQTLTRPRLWTYLLTGIAVAIGLLAKYNFVILPIAAIIAVLPEPDLRKRIFDWRIIPAVLIVVALCLPHGLWVLGNLDEATTDTIKAMRHNASGNAVSDRLSGIGTLVIGALAGGLPILAFFFLAFRRPLFGVWRAQTMWTRVIGRTILLCLIVVALIGLGFGATTISEKWLSPFLLLLPLYLCLKLEASGVDTSLSVPRFLPPVAVLALGAIVYIAAGNVIGPRIGQYEKENLPSGPFIAQIVADHSGAKPAYVVSSEPFLAASARLELPQARVLLQNFTYQPFLSDAERMQTGLLVWQADHDGAAVPDSLKPYLQKNGIATDNLQSMTRTVPYLFSGGRKSVIFGYAWLGPAR